MEDLKRRSIPQFKTCFAFEKGTCQILTSMICLKRKCPFHKTQSEYDEQNIKSDKNARY